jgi:hypothetical protein
MPVVVVVGKFGTYQPRCLLQMCYGVLSTSATDVYGVALFVPRLRMQQL